MSASLSPRARRRSVECNIQNDNLVPRSTVHQKKRRRVSVDRDASSSVNNKDNRIRTLVKRVLFHQREANAVYGGTGLFDNYTYREHAIIMLLRRHGYADMQHLGGRKGPDARCESESWTQVSIKSSSLPPNAKKLTDKVGFGEWCRQHTERARKDALLIGYQAIVYGVFRHMHYDPILVVLVHGSTALQKHAQLVRTQQQKFFDGRGEQERKRDSIRIRLCQLYDALDPQEFQMFFQGRRVRNVNAFLCTLRRRGGISIDNIPFQNDDEYDDDDDYVHNSTRDKSDYN